MCPEWGTTIAEQFHNHENTDSSCMVFSLLVFGSWVFEGGGVRPSPPESRSTRDFLVSTGFSVIFRLGGLARHGRGSSCQPPEWGRAGAAH